MKQLIRIYHHYSLWEEIKYNMWGKVNDRKSFLDRAIKFTSDHILYGSYMKKVVSEWKYSCEHNLSDITQNRKAWLGHAACALSFNCPEDIVREAWNKLTEKQQFLANKEAEKNIIYWENNIYSRRGNNAQKEFKF